jgi:hypothetical protein
MLPDLRIWLNHFEYHAERRPSVPEGVSNRLSAAERALIADSIATFQLGEQSDGHEFLTAAWRFGKLYDLPELARITELFIREEQHHAALLGEFMDAHQIPRKRHDWTNTAFRTLRQMGDYEMYLSVLVTAELIGNVYYRALGAATQCQHLRALCRLLVADHLAHVAFQSDMLLALRAQRLCAVREVVAATHRSFFLSSALVVWRMHEPVLRTAGYTLRQFVRACDAQFVFYLSAPARPAAAVVGRE